ncbi:MATE family efflux transporter [Polaribacter sejongensis]
MGIVYLTIPFLLKYLGTSNYGVWVTIFSIVNILFFVDAGIANGLKTKLTEAISNKNVRLAKEYISTASVLIFFISIGFFLVGGATIYLVNLNSLLNVGDLVSNKNLQSVFFVILIFIVSNFVLSLYKVFFYAIQKASVVEFSLFLYRFVVFGFIYYALNNLESSILNVAYIYGLSNLIVSIIFSFVFFNKRKEILPSIKSFKKERINDLMSLSIRFFIIQMCMIVIFITDNIIISNLLGPDAVTNYDIVFKLFQVIIMLSTILLDPFWSLFTDAYQKKDFIWIRATLKRMNKLFILVCIGTIVLILLTKTIISIWIGKEFVVDETLTYFMGLFVLIRIFPLVYMYFLNAIGEIKLQMYLFIMGAVINIPVSVLFVKYLDLGISGVILGTSVSIIAMVFLLPFQTYNILKKNEILKN